MSFICTVKYEDVRFDVYGDIEAPDHSVGYDGSVSIYCICFENDKYRTDLSDILDKSFKEYVEGETYLAVESLAEDQEAERIDRAYEEYRDQQFDK